MEEKRKNECPCGADKYRRRDKIIAVSVIAAASAFIIAMLIINA